MERLPQSACASLISHPVTLPNEGGVGRLLFLDIASVFVFVAQTFFPISLFCGYKCEYICPYVSSTYRNIHYCCLVLSMRTNILIWFNNLVLMAVSALFSSFLPSFPWFLLMSSPFLPLHSPFFSILWPLSFPKPQRDKLWLFLKTALYLQGTDSFSFICHHKVEVSAQSGQNQDLFKHAF